MIFSNKTKKNKTEAKNLIYAVFVLIFVGICVILILINPLKKQTEDNVKTIQNITPVLFRTQNYTPNNVIEKEIKLNKPAISLKMEGILPVDSSLFIINESINFKTKGFLHQTYRIIIYNNKGVKVFESEEIKNQNYMFESKLKPGIYYWKIQLKNNFIWAGRFFILYQ